MVTPHPKRITEDRGQHIGRVQFIGGRQRSSIQRLDPQSAEETSANDVTTDAVRAAIVANGDVRLAVAEDRRETFIALRERAVSVVGEETSRTKRSRDLHQTHEFTRFADRQRPQQQSVQQAEDCAVQPDAEGEQQDHTRKEGGRFTTQSQSITNILCQGAAHNLNPTMISIIWPEQNGITLYTSLALSIMAPRS